MTRLLPPFALTLALSACVGAHGRAEPLYPIDGARPLPEKVARVGGYVLQIDDSRVNEGKMYEVLPGCHAIRTPERWGRGSETGAVSVRTGQRAFSIDAKPGYTYDVAIRTRFLGGGPTGTATLQVTETDADGKKTPDFRPQANPKCVEAEAP